MLRATSWCLTPHSLASRDINDKDELCDSYLGFLIYKNHTVSLFKVSNLSLPKYHTCSFGTQMIEDKLLK